MKNNIYIVTAIGSILGCTRTISKARKLLVGLGYPIHSLSYIRNEIKHEDAYGYQIPDSSDDLTIVKTVLL